MTTYQAMLPMYALPGTQDDILKFWAGLREALPGEIEVAFHLSGLDDDGQALLGHPDLILGQTCWGPIRAGETPPLEVLAQPDYGTYPGGLGPYYRSAIIAPGAGDDAPVPQVDTAEIPATALRNKTLAFNDPTSLSGRVCLEEDTDMPFARAIETGSHHASVQAVAGGTADVAAIDCRTLALLRRTDPAARAVHVIGWTARRMGLPYVASPAVPESLRNALRTALLAGGNHPPTAQPPNL